VSGHDSIDEKDSKVFEQVSHILIHVQCNTRKCENVTSDTNYVIRLCLRRAKPSEDSVLLLLRAQFSFLSILHNSIIYKHLMQEQATILKMQENRPSARQWSAVALCKGVFMIDKLTRSPSWLSLFRPYSPMLVCASKT
jgi:hypothetical protein